jgi:hypothetical protein
MQKPTIVIRMGAEGVTLSTPETPHPVPLDREGRREVARFLGRLFEKPQAKRPRRRRRSPA